jgi:SGNH domain (fused to AT3 domains)
MNRRHFSSQFLLLATVALGVATTGCGVSSNPPSSSSSGTASPVSITSSQFADASQVAAAVASGESLTQLPASAVPQLEKLASDPPLGDSVSNICIPPSTFQSVTNVATCTFGDIHSSRTLVLVGDSRAQMWVDVFIRIATAAHVKLVVLAKDACPAALGTFRLTNSQGVPGNSPWPACTAWHRFVLSTIRKLAPQVVVISSSDNLFLMSSIATGYAPSSEVKSAYSALLRAIPASSKRVVIDGFPNPGNTISPTLCLSKNPSAIQKCDYRPTAYQLADNAAVRHAAEHNGAGYINEAAWLCAAKCPAVIGGIPPYTIDGFHIQSSYATYLTGVMWAALSPYLG